MDPITFATAYALSTSVGLRPFLTLAIASVAMHFGYLHVAPAFAYLGTDGVALLLFALAALEFFGDKIPAVDHALHALHFGIKPIAAAILVGGAVGTGTGAPDAFTDSAMALSALNAVGIHAGITTLRGASSAMTLGIANPFLSLIEDIITICATLLAIALPILGALLSALIALSAAYIIRRAYQTLKTPHTNDRPSPPTMAPPPAANVAIPSPIAPLQS